MFYESLPICTDIKCYYCKEITTKDNRIVAFGYWNGFRMWSHKECEKEGYKKVAYECQSIDSDCNDCKYFKRTIMMGKGVWKGQCINEKRNPQEHAKLKEDKVLAYPNFCSGHICFVHRKI